MKFSNRRGRPKSNKQIKDLGTKELRAKRIKEMTMEPIELCLKHDFITQEQHQAALRLQWLYNLHFGAPRIKAYDLKEVRGKSTHDYDDEWLAKRFDEYLSCLLELQKMGAKSITMNVCVFGLRPSFLCKTKQAVSLYTRQAEYHKALKLKEGLTALAKKFGMKG
jgi:hypothetical protein